MLINTIPANDASSKQRQLIDVKILLEIEKE